jgi:16S rRNA (guanine(966)-N(2))-methyltransferase RsmD
MFAGSGSVGFEAISRGSSKTYFLEMNKLAIQIIRKNSLNFVGENLEIVSGDSFQNIEKVLTELQREAILYVDPPFSIRDGMGNIYLNTIKKLNSLDVSKIYLIIVEHLSDEVFPEEIATKKLFKSRKFGKTSLSYFK